VTFGIPGVDNNRVAWYVANLPGGRADEVSGGRRIFAQFDGVAGSGRRNSIPASLFAHNGDARPGAGRRSHRLQHGAQNRREQKGLTGILQRNSYRRLRFIPKDFFNPPLRDRRAFDTLKKNATLTRAEVLAAINEIPGCPKAHLWKSVDKNGLKRFSRPAMAAGIERCP
jgi:hypothetical protein